VSGVLQVNGPAQASGDDPTMNVKSAGPWLWLADIAPALRPQWIDAHAAWLSGEEQTRLQRFGRSERRAQFLAGHILLRRLVAAHTGAAPQDVLIDARADARPAVVARVAVQASLAHSRQWVAALLQTGAASVGVDIEFMHPARQIESIVKLACDVDASSREHAYLVWAQREAAIKAGGGASTWVTSWTGHAIAVCAAAIPAVAVLDLGADEAPRGLELTWTVRPALPLARVVDGR
jgi:hypothetical protein